MNEQIVKCESERGLLFAIKVREIAIEKRLTNGARYLNPYDRETLARLDVLEQSDQIKRKPTRFVKREGSYKRAIRYDENGAACEWETVTL